jgi:hypothetical protein
VPASTSHIASNSGCGFCVWPASEPPDDFSRRLSLGSQVNCFEDIPDEIGYSRSNWRNLFSELLNNLSRCFVKLDKRFCKLLACFHCAPERFRVYDSISDIIL